MSKKQSSKIFIVILIGTVVLLILSRDRLLFLINYHFSKGSETSTSIQTSESPSPEQIACEENNGEWITGPFREGPFCNIPQLDEGKKCTDGGECLSGNCVGDNPYYGRCTKFKYIYGCFSILKKGLIQQVCVD